MIDDQPTDPSYEEWQRALRNENELLGQQCSDCGHTTVAPKAACVRCGGRDLDRVQVSTDGTVYSWTTIAVAPADFEAPYDVALIDLGEARVLGRVRGDPSIDDPVELVDVVDSGPGPAPVFGTVDE